MPLSLTTVTHCKCVSHGCNRGDLGYTEVPRSTRNRHLDDDLELSMRGLSLDGGDIESTARSAVVDRVPDAISNINANTVPRSTIDKNSDSIGLMKSIFDEFQRRMVSFVGLTDNVDMGIASMKISNEAALLQGHISWITTTMSNLKSLSMGSSDELDKQRKLLTQILQNKLHDIRRWEESHYDELQRVLSIVSFKADKRETEKFYRQSISSSHPLHLLSMFIVVVLNTIHTLPDRPSNFLLAMHRKLLRLAVQSFSAEDDLRSKRLSVIKHLPKDIRTARSHFHVEPDILIFASCTKCSALYEPTFDENQGFYVYPSSWCIHKDLNGMKCGAKILKWQASGKQTIQIPIRPFGYRSLHDYLGEMLSRPGVEDLLERRPSTAQPYELTDIFDGSAIREFRGPEGDLCFTKNGLGRELYLAWAMSVDWFNPFYNKAAGKSVSVGVITMVCLNLPLHLRHEISNVYVVAIIPGPREPSIHQINHFLGPIKCELQESWDKGIQFTRTNKFPGGRRVFSILIPLIADLPASRKVSGTAGHNATCACPLCLRKKHEFSNFSVTFERRSREEHVRLAMQWKNATSKRQQELLAKQNGIRHSVIFDLSYWEPSFIAVDTMHNLFLGLVHYHFRVVLGIDYKKTSDTKEQGLTMKKITKILEILKKPGGPTFSSLRKFSINDLFEFHKCQRIQLPQDNGNGKYRKDDLVVSLLSCDLVKRPKDEAGAMQVHVLMQAEREEVLEQDILPYYEIGNEISAASRKTNPVDSKAKSSNAKSPFIGPKEIDAIQTAIRATSRPSWQQGPPKGFGTSQQGKLKADQWRTLIEFDLPVILVDMWLDSECSDGSASKDKTERLKLLDVTMELAIAIMWGTSRRTSVEHAALYTMHLQRYLQGLQKLSPRPKLMPNHHAALHVGEQLILFGPVNGWWSYPYERLIGTLQKSNTNYRIGEMELTMLRSYYASAELHRLLRSSDCPPILRDSVATLDKYFPMHALGSYTFNVLHPYSIQDSFKAKAKDDDDDDSLKANPRMERLDDDIYDALSSSDMEISSEQRQSRKFLVHKSHVLNGVKFTSRESERDSIIFYQNGPAKSPGFIRKIVSTMNGRVLFATHSYLDSNVVNPFDQWPDFRASVCSQLVSEKVQIIDPSNIYICHAARRPWKGRKLYVMRPIDRNY